MNNVLQNRYFYILSITLITFISFYPCLEAEFVNWDDNVYIYENKAVTDFSLDNISEGIKVIFTQEYNSIYAPLTTLSFALEKVIFGLENPFYWHLNNLLIHLLVVVFCFLRL